MGFESALQSSPERTRPKTEATPERVKRLKKLRQAIGRFILAGTVFMGGVQELSAAPERHIEGKSIGLVHDIKTKEGIVEQSEILNFLSIFPDNWATGKQVGAIIDLDSLDQNRRDIWEHKMSKDTLALFAPLGKVVAFNSTVMRKQSRNVFFYTLTHEICHANDFIFDLDLDMLQRHELETAVSDRIKSENRFKSAYSEKLMAQKHDHVALEYWAEICAQYFTDPSQLDIEDFELVHGHVLKNDPDYNWKERLEERQKISSPGAAEHIVKK